MVQDYLGNKYETTKEMCEHHNIKLGTYNSRIKAGWSIQRALEVPTAQYTMPVKCKDHLGNKFNSVSDMVKYWNISYSTYNSRLSSGCSMREALERPRIIHNRELVCDHLGNKFKSIKQMCKYWNINVATFNSRVKLGWDLRSSLEQKAKLSKYIKDNNKCEKGTRVCKDHLGNEFKSTTAMCNYWGISLRQYDNRYKHWGDDIEKILTTPVRKRTKVTDHLGNEFSTQCEMLAFWGVSSDIFKYRRKNGLSIQKCLEGQSSLQIDHMGNKFYTIKDMCSHYDIKYADYIRKMRLGKTLQQILEE